MSPDVTSLQRFWRELCEFTHATRGAQQIGMNLLEEPDGSLQTQTNLRFIEILLDFSYHLLGRHLIVPEIAYLGRKIAHRPSTIKALRRELRELQAAKRIDYSDDARRLSSAYRRRWLISESPKPRRTPKSSTIYVHTSYPPPAPAT